MDPDDASSIEDELEERLLELRDPIDGQPVTDRVVRRAEVIADRSPAGRPTCSRCSAVSAMRPPTLAASEPITDHRDRPWGYHHLDGVFLAVGPAVRPGAFEGGLDIVDVLPTALHVSELAVPEVWTAVSCTKS